MRTSIISNPARRSLAAAMFLSILFFLSITTSVSFGQQMSYLVTASDSSLNLYDLATSNLIKKINQGSGDGSVASGPNSRLAFVSSGGYLSVIDLTIGREIQRIRNVYASPYGPSMAFTRDGKWLLVADFGNYVLDIVDPVGLKVVRQVSLVAAMRDGVNSLSSVFVVGSKAYVTTCASDASVPAIAEVDLNTFVAKPIPIPAGYLDFGGTGAVPNAATTPDERYLLLPQINSADGLYHLLFISTLTDTVVMDKTMDFDPDGILATTSWNASRQYGYFLGFDINGNFSVTVLDLRPGSQTYGHLLPSTEVVLHGYFHYAWSAAISPDGSKLVVVGFKGGREGPQPNAVVIDTGLMLTNPGQAIVGQATVAGGAPTRGVTIASVSTTVPPTAPTVTGVSGDVTNNAATPIHVFGTNFASGAQVRIGSMSPLPAIVNSSTDLQVTVPVNAPGAPGLDVVVTNTNALSPPAQQNQSGLLSGGLNIFVNPAFQPHHEFAALNRADGSVSLFDFSRRSMVNIAMDQPGVLGLTFNFEGAEIYSASNGFRYASGTPKVLSLKLSTDSVTPIDLPGFPFRGDTGIASSRNPFTGNPAVVYGWNSASGQADVQVNMVDANPASPTFNSVIGTYYAGLTAGDIYILHSGTATPDGKWVYVNYLDNSTGQHGIAIFDIVNGGPATIFSTSSLGVNDLQWDMYAAPDNQSLLLDSATYGAIAVFDIGQNPKNPTLVTTIKGIFAHSSLFMSYQVVGNRLFALDVGDSMLFAFNFDRQHSNFSQLGAYVFQNNSSFGAGPYLAVSPDGALIYVPAVGDDMISVFDANKLANRQPPLITNLASFHAPNVMAVSPVTH
jgi:hypothetical protein